MLPVDGEDLTQSPPDPEVVEIESDAADIRLHELTAGDEKMFNALGHFLLADPEREIEQLGDVASLVKNAEDSLSKGETQAALVDYDYAAKISMYRENKDETKKYLEIAEQVTQTEEEHQMHRTLLSNLDRAMEISREYQKVRASHPNREKIISEAEPAYPDDTPIFPKEA